MSNDFQALLNNKGANNIGLGSNVGANSQRKVTILISAMLMLRASPTRSTSFATTQ